MSVTMLDAKRLIVPLLLILIFVGFLMASSGNDSQYQIKKDAINKLLTSADSLVDLREFQTAMLLSDSALSFARKNCKDDEELIVDCIEQVALAHFDPSNYQIREAQFRVRDSLFSIVYEFRKKKYGRNNLKLGTAAIHLAEMKLALKDFNQSQKLLKEGIEIVSISLGPEHEKTLLLRSRLADHLSEMGKYDSAINEQLGVLDALAKSPETARMRGWSLHRLAYYYMCDGDYNKSKDSYLKAIPLIEESLGKEHPEIGWLMNELGKVFNRLSKFDKSKKCFERSLAIREKSVGMDHPDVSETLTHLATLYTNLGEYSQAELLQKRALSIREKRLPPEHPDITNNLHNLANLNFYQGKYDAAESLHRRILSIAAKEYNPRSIQAAGSLFDLSLIYLNSDKLKEAEEVCLEAIEIVERTYPPDHPDKGIFLSRLAAIYLKQNKVVDAQKAFEASSNILRDKLGPIHPRIAMNLSGLAKLNLLMNKSGRAESLFVDAMKMAEQVYGRQHPIVADYVKDLAKYYTYNGSLELSLKYYKRFLDLRRNFVTKLFNFADSNQKFRWLGQFPLIEEELLTLAVNNPTEEAKQLSLEMILNGKAALYKASLEERNIAYCSEESWVEENISAHNGICQSIANLSIQHALRNSVEINPDSLNKLFSIRDSLESAISQYCSKFGENVWFKLSDTKAIAGALSKNELLWEFIKINKPQLKRSTNINSEEISTTYISFLLKKDGSIDVFDHGNAATIDSLVRRTRDLILSSVSKIYSSEITKSEEEIKFVTCKLYDLLIEPISEEIRNMPSLLISGDGLLNLIPFEILVAPDGSYLIENYKISYLSSGQSLQEFTNMPTQDFQGAIVISNPDFDFFKSDPSNEDNQKYSSKPNLSGSNVSSSISVQNCLNGKFPPLSYGRNEAELICTLLREHDFEYVFDYYGEQANEKFVKNLARAPDILHIVTHGFFCEKSDNGLEKRLENPLVRCGLALAGANTIFNEPYSLETGEDGIFTALEISALNLLGTRLVVLSACETGVGDLIDGEGVMSLCRAFQCAGSESIIVSLWKIPDKEAAEIMVRFYRNWLSGKSKSDALRVSSLKMLSLAREKYGCGHPLLWAGFVLSGNPN